MSNTYGYVRVSSRDQKVSRQIDALNAYGVCTSKIFVDQQSGKDFQRPAYRELCEIICSGDTIVITSIDRLGRNYSEVLSQWRFLSKQKGVFITVLDMPLLNTHTSRDLTQQLIADIVLQLLSYVAEVERTFIKKRQAEGIAAALKRGVRFGAPVKQPPSAFKDIMIDWKSGGISERKAAKKLGVSRGTFRKWCNGV